MVSVVGLDIDFTFCFIFVFMFWMGAPFKIGAPFWLATGSVVSNDYFLFLRA
jgi:hypothetical protein